MARPVIYGSVIRVEIRLKGQLERPIVMDIHQKASMDLDFSVTWWKGRTYPDKGSDYYLITMVKVEEISMITILSKELVDPRFVMQERRGRQGDEDEYPTVEEDKGKE